MNTYRMYKYRAINKNSLDSLIKGSIYFSPINKLNDPFDCKVDVQKSVINAAKLSSSRKEKQLNKFLKTQEFFEKFNQKTGELGVCSFSFELKSVLMWSHYADEHKGMAILYEFPEAFLYDGDKFISTVRITYEENPLTNWFIKIANKLPIQKDNLNIELAMKYLTVKSPDWEYEKEARIIRPRPGLLKIKKDYIKQICFGLNTSGSDIDLIKEIIGHYKHKVDLCRVARTDDDFGITINDI